MQDLVQGRTPNGTRKKVRLLNPEKPFKGDYIGIRKNYIDPFFLIAKYGSKWTEFECRTFFASDRKGDGTDCHEVTSFLVVMTAFTMDMAVL